MSRIRGRLERLERDRPDRANGSPSSNFFDLLLGVLLETVDPGDLSPVDRAWVERFCGVWGAEISQRLEGDPAEAR